MATIGYLKTFYKMPAESYPVSVDFATALDSADSIDSATVVATDRADGTDTSADMIADVATAAKAVTLRVQAGESGHSYAVAITVVTDDGNAYEEAVLVKVTAPAAVE